MAGTSTTSTRFTLRIPNGLMERLKSAATARNRTASAVLVEAVERGLGEGAPSTALTVAAGPPAPLPRDLIKEIAMDIGKEIASHIETMYPNAVQAAGRNMLLSVRNSVHNEIMAALETTDAAEIAERLASRRQHRRRHRAAYRHIRHQPVTSDVTNDE